MIEHLRKAAKHLRVTVGLGIDVVDKTRARQVEIALVNRAGGMVEVVIGFAAEGFCNPVDCVGFLIAYHGHGILCPALNGQILQTSIADVSHSP